MIDFNIGVQIFDTLIERLVGADYVEPVLTSVQKSCRLLKQFLQADKELGVTELSKQLNQSKGSIHKLLTTLESEGFIKQNPQNKQYSLGYTLLELGTKVKKDNDWVEMTEPFLKDLMEATKELTCLCIIDGTDAIYLNKIETHYYPIRFAVEAYRRFPLYATSASRVILAHASETIIDQVLEKELLQFTPYSFKSPEEIKERLVQIRKNGYEYSSNLRNIGVTGIAAPIFDTDGQVPAAISLIGPSDRMNEKKEHNIQAVLDTTRKISRLLGYRK